MGICVQSKNQMLAFDELISSTLTQGLVCSQRTYWDLFESSFLYYQIHPQLKQVQPVQQQQYNMIRNSKSCNNFHFSDRPLTYWEYASAKIESYPSTTKRLLNNDYYGGCRNHGSYQPYIVCTKNRASAKQIRSKQKNEIRDRKGKIQRQICADQMRIKTGFYHLNRNSNRCRTIETQRPCFHNYKY